MKMNRTQRLVVALSATAALLIVFAHNPISGYTTDSGYPTTEWVRKEGCSDGEARELEDVNGKLAADQIAAIRSGDYINNILKKTRLTQKCLELQQDYRYVEKNFLSWYSDGALIAWLGVMSNLLLTLGLNLVLGGIWYFILADRAVATKDQE